MRTFMGGLLHSLLNTVIHSLATHWRALGDKLAHWLIYSLRHSRIDSLVRAVIDTLIDSLLGALVNSPNRGSPINELIGVWLE